MSKEELLIAFLGLVFTSVRELIQAGEDRAKQIEALMKAEEALYQVRMQTKFGDR